MRAAMVSGLVCGVLLSGCWGELGEGRVVAVGLIEPRSGNTTLYGSALFAENEAGEITLTVKLTGAPPGEHGLHLHQVADCSADNASSAGAHWNPEGHMHGMPARDSHLGDLGNIKVGDNGRGKLVIRNAGWTAGDGSEHDVKGRAIVVHAGVDDFSDPAGNSGGRIGCGEIGAAGLQEAH